MTGTFNTVYKKIKEKYGVAVAMTVIDYGEELRATITVDGEDRYHYTVDKL